MLIKLIETDRGSIKFLERQEIGYFSFVSNEGAAVRTEFALMHTSVFMRIIPENSSVAVGNYTCSPDVLRADWLEPVIAEQQPRGIRTLEQIARHLDDVAYPAVHKWETSRSNFNQASRESSYAHNVARGRDWTCDALDSDVYQYEPSLKVREESFAASQKMMEDPELRSLVVELARLVDRFVGRWVVSASVELLVPDEDPESWMLLVVRSLSLPVRQVIKMSIEIGAELSKLLQEGNGSWNNEKWGHLSFVVEPRRENGPT